MIQFTNVTKRYKTNIGLDDVSVNINKGDFVFLVGSSGAGKSTFIKLILKELDADSGSIQVNGKEVTTLSNRLVPKLRRNIGIVFQEFRLLPKMTVFENVAFAMEIVHSKPRTIKRQVPQALSLVGISEKAYKYPDELSAGEQQRVAIARAIVNNPTVLIADEPTGNLDPDTAWDIMQLLEKINLRGTTIVMVTHAKDIVDKMNKRVIAIEKGKITRDNIGTYEEAELLAHSLEAAPSGKTAKANSKTADVEPKKGKKTKEKLARDTITVPTSGENETPDSETKEASIDEIAEAIVKEAIKQSAEEEKSADIEATTKAPKNKDETESEKMEGAGR
jgi:cell division transport system ATP-binding protein